MTPCGRRRKHVALGGKAEAAHKPASTGANFRSRRGDALKGPHAVLGRHLAASRPTGLLSPAGENPDAPVRDHTRETLAMTFRRSWICQEGRHERSCPEHDSRHHAACATEPCDVLATWRRLLRAGTAQHVDWSRQLDIRISVAIPQPPAIEQRVHARVGVCHVELLLHPAHGVPDGPELSRVGLGEQRGDLVLRKS